MNKLLFIFFLLVAHVSTSQNEQQELYSIVDSLYSAEKYQEAFDNSLTLCELISSDEGENNTNYYNALILTGDCLYSLEKYQEANQYYVQAKSIPFVYEKKGFNYAFAQYSIGQTHLELNELENAETAFISTAEIYENTIGTDNEYYLYLLEDLIRIYSSQNNEESAYTIYSYYVPLKERLLDYEESNLGRDYYEYALLAYHFEDYNFAEKKALDALSLLEYYQAKNYDEILDAIMLLGDLYTDIGDYYLIIPLMDEAEKILNNPSNAIENYDNTKNKIQFLKGLAFYELDDYKNSILSLNNAKDGLQDYDKILAYYTLGKSQSATGSKSKALASMKSVNKLLLNEAEYSADVHAEILNEIALLEMSLAKYDDAIKSFTKTIEVLNDENYDLKLIVMANLAALYSELGQFSQAEDMYLDVLEVAENDHSKPGLYTTVLNNLGLLYMDWGDYSKCELLLHECYIVSGRVFGVNTIDHANSCNNLGAFYFEVGNYDKSVDYFVSALYSYEELKGDSSTEYSAVLNNIGMLFMEVENYEEALVYLDSARSIEIKLIGEEHPDYATTLNNLSEAYSKLGKYDTAEKYLKQAMDIIKGHFTESHPDYALYLMNLGALEMEQDRLDEATKTLKKSLYLHQEIYGNDHPRYAIAQYHFASLLRKQNKISDATPHYNSSIEVLQKHLSNFLPFLSEKEKAGFYNEYIKYFHDYFSFSIEAKEVDPAIQGRAFNLSLTLKGLLLRSSKAMRNIVLNSGNDELIKVYDEWVSIKKRIAEISALPLEQRGDNLEKLESKANEYEKNLYQLSDELGASTLNEPNWEKIRTKLKDKEVAIEFVSYKNSEIDKTQYAALILRKNSTYPELLPLFNEEELLAIIDFYGANNYDYIRKIYDYSEKEQTKLYDLIWKPLEASLDDCNKVFVSSTGILHRVSLYAIASGENKYLIDAYELISLNSAGDILDYDDVHSSSMENIALMGGINYDTKESDKVVWEYLPGSKDEVEAIKESLSKKKKNVSYETSDNATETYFKEVAENSDIVHIATHGFFFPDPQKVWSMFEAEDTPEEDIEFRGQSNVVGVTSFTENKNPLMRSGLVFAGVHDLWSGEITSKEDDGILTALEVSQLNLSNTELAVLSACETGLGEIVGDEGVYGLKRTFKIAGVKYLIISLWQVPDKETKEFMMLFYEELYKEGGASIYEAFENAQRQMREKYDPYFWAAFILIR
jgi:CHAT domain-containing protein/tetratricopeptide (TPR) repeat protein